MRCRFSSFRRSLLIALLTAPLFFGDCVNIAIRTSISSLFDAANPAIVDAAGAAGTQAGDMAAQAP